MVEKSLEKPAPLIMSDAKPAKAARIATLKATPYDSHNLEAE
jgi:hypothetical protein